MREREGDESVSAVAASPALQLRPGSREGTGRREQGAGAPSGKGLTGLVR